MNQTKKNIFLLVSVLGLTTAPAFAQPQKKFNDTATLNEVVVTATRTEKSIGDIPVPIQVISKKFIQQTGSQKLIDILQQQAGLVLADNPLGQALQGYPNPFGSGIQLQGLDPAYTLILLDGEPLTGRNAGILNLGRIAVGNIKQIEIVKGPATSLYGSDALAGVINIITDRPKNNSALLQTHYSSHNTWGFTGSGSFHKNKTTLQLFANRYSSSGYDMDKSIYGKTVDPYHNYSFAARLTVDLSKFIQLQTAARFFTQKQFNNYLVYTGAQPQTVEGSTNESDWSISNQLHTRFSRSLKLITRLYATGYRDNADVFSQKDGSLYDHSYLQQFLLKPEVQAEIGRKANQLLIAGAGYNYETIDASRYASAKQFNAVYGYIQKEWLPINTLNITAGARLDKHSLYNIQFNPKLALAWKPMQKLTILGSIGTGFKAPDFRQQFLFFTNSLVGYTLLGANELNNGLISLKQQGQIDPNVDINPYLTDHTLLPEHSLGINLGVRYLPDNNTTINAGIFRNDIDNLIDRYNLPFTKTNGQSIYSYVNVNRVFTEGFDVNVNRKLGKTWQINAGYQYLDARDKDVLNRLKENKIVKRDPVTYQSEYVKRSEYGGLFNRSKHTANAQLAWTHPQHWLNGNLRLVYRGRFGYSDINGDNILDDNREYADGYVLLNAAFGISLHHGIGIQIGSDNILNHTDRDKLPNLSGRTFFINASIDLTKIISKTHKL